MALIHCDFASETLGMACSMCVILPQQTSEEMNTHAMSGIGTKHPTLYLLHGLSDDHTMWQRRTSIERYVANTGIAVVMPGVGRSWYTNMLHGLNYWDFISEEVPRLARQFFPLSDRREDNFVAGLSMGGYGAFKLALRHPEKFAAAASLSGVLDIARRAEGVDPGWNEEFANIFGDPKTMAGSENDLLHLASELAKSGAPTPHLFQACGTEDYLYENNLAFRDHAAKIGLPLLYDEGPGAHSWDFWDQWIQRVIGWLRTTNNKTA